MNTIEILATLVAVIGAPTLLIWRHMTIVKNCEHDFMVRKHYMGNVPVSIYNKCLKCGVKR